MDGWQEDQIQTLLSAKTDASFFAALTQTAILLGFDYCAYGMRMPLPVSNPRLIMLNNYSSSWQQRYANESYIAVDPTVAHGMRSTMPLVWSEDVFTTCRPFWEDARSHGLHVGLAQSCYDAKGVGGLLSLVRSNDQLSPKELLHIQLKMSWLAQIAHEGLSRLLVPKYLPEAAVELTSREIEVLRWTADGRTSSEASEIMRISERTVNFHINNVLKKLNVTNKTAAAIKAAVLGLL